MDTVVPHLSLQNVIDRFPCREGHRLRAVNHAVGRNPVCFALCQVIHVIQDGGAFHVQGTCELLAAVYYLILGFYRDRLSFRNRVCIVVIRAGCLTGRACSCRVSITFGSSACTRTACGCLCGRAGLIFAQILLFLIPVMLVHIVPVDILRLLRVLSFRGLLLLLRRISRSRLRRSLFLFHCAGLTPA